MFVMKKFIASAITSVALVGVGFVSTQIIPQSTAQEVQASEWVNSYIQSQNIKPVSIENRGGTFNRFFGYAHGVGKPEGVLIHDTATPGATAENEVAYFNRSWKTNQTYVHAFVDGNKIINIHDTNYGVWGAGPTANSKFIQVELCNVSTNDQFARSISNDAYYVASKLIEYNLPFIPNQTVVTHRQAAERWHDTNHRDPDGYLAKWNYDMNQFHQLIGLYYNNLKNAGSVDGNGQVTSPQTVLPDPSKHEGTLLVERPGSFMVPLVAFKQDGTTEPSNRGLANKTPWYTDQDRMYQGHKYYRVSVNEWVEDTHAQFTGLKR